MAENGGESVISKTAAVLLGSSETTFYTISVYFGAAGIKDGRYAAKAALIGDFFGVLAAIWAANIFF
jgi:spore maturation protein B